jgi:peptide/nickel transport system substrate-binding protein
MYPRLVTPNPSTGQLGPYLATSWTPSAGDRVWTFHLRPNAKWSDGAPLTASDVAFTFNTILKFGKGPTALFVEYLLSMTSAVATNPTTVVLNFSSPLPSVLSLPGHLFILPEHIWSSVAAGNGAALKTFANVPTPGQPVVAGGPWMLTSYTKNAAQLFVRNPNYFGKTPSIAGVGVQYFTSADAAVTALKTGAIDSYQGVPPTAASSIQTASFDLSNVPSDTFSGIAVNLNPARTTHTELTNPTVRMALEYATDRPQIARTAFDGYAQPGASTVPPATGSFYDKTIQGLPFDTGKANQLLDQAGFIRGPGGTRVANGSPMAYTVLMTSTNAVEFNILKSDYQQIGVQLTASTLDANALSQAITEPNNKYLNYDLAIEQGTAGDFDPDYGLSTFTCSALGTFSETGYCDPTYDQLYLQQKTATGAQRVNLIHQMAKMIYDSRAYITVVYNDELVAWNKSWTGFAPGPAGIFGNLSPNGLTGVHKV